MKNPSHGLGTYADHVVIPAKNLAQTPANISAEQAAGVPLCALTAWQALVDHGQLNKGHKVLVIGASGGVGSFAVQIAKALSSNVDGICSEANAPFVQSLGADCVYDYKTQDITTLTGQYDIIFDTIGRHSPATCHHLLSKNSTFVTTVPAPIFLLKHLASKFLSLLSIPHIRKRVVMVKLNPKQLTAITEFIQQDKIVPAVDSVYAMEDVAEAHLRSQSKRAVGKIIIRTQSK